MSFVYRKKSFDFLLLFIFEDRIWVALGDIARAPDRRSFGGLLEIDGKGFKKFTKAHRLENR